VKKNEKIVFVGMSGGVDSSVAAYLLKKQGYDVVGVFMRSYNLDGCSEIDAQDARRVAEHIGIPFYVWDFEEEYKKKVVDYIINGYKSGITPNPDIMCNKEIKFGLFFEKAIKAGADFVATGHYVKIKSKFQKNKNGTNKKNYELFEAKDKNKDQSYFLWTLGQKQLEKCLFPIGDYEKPMVREIARKASLPTAEKKDSQGICFLGKISIDDFLKKHIKEKKGLILSEFGDVIGKHSGAIFYTIGQRHFGADFKFASNFSKDKIINSKNGKDVLIKDKTKRGRFYIAKKDIQKNTIVVVEGSDSQALYKNEIMISDVNFISEINLSAPISVLARVRYRQPLSSAILSSAGNKIYSLVFGQPQKFISSGQSAVFYLKNGKMIGGGIIV
jgi:tRNA-specific 2-thiouridylase